MTTSSIHLKALSCRDLKTPIPFQTPSIYAVVCIGDGGDRAHRKKNSPPRQQQKTPIDRSGGNNPEWDHEMRFDIDLEREGGMFLEFDLFSEKFFLLGEKLVGEVRVPLRDLAAEDPSHSFRTVSYQVKAADGKPGGVLTFTYRTSSPLVTMQQSSIYPSVGELPVRYPDPNDVLTAGEYSSPPAEPPTFSLPEVAGYYPSLPLPPPATGPEPAFFYPPPVPPPELGFYYPPPPPPSLDTYRVEERACGCPTYGFNAVGQRQLPDMDARWGGRTVGWAGTWNGR